MVSWTFFVHTRLGKPNREVPWIIAAAVVVVGLGIWVIVGTRANPDTPSTGTGMAPADPYAASLPISGLQMSKAIAFSGAKVTYIDGQIANTGNRTLTAITVQVGFHSDVGQFAQRLAMPLSLIRTREPYVDIQPVSYPLHLEPGQKRDFRLIFDTVPPDWNQQYPEVRVISVRRQVGLFFPYIGNFAAWPPSIFFAPTREKCHAACCFRGVVKISTLYAELPVNLNHMSNIKILFRLATFWPRLQYSQASMKRAVCFIFQPVSG